MENRIVALTKKLIAFRTSADNKEALDACLQVLLAELTEFTIERFEKDGVKSALIYNTPKRPKKFKIILNAHLDVIPGKDFQYTPNMIGNRLYGVGAMDMKANAACLLLVFKEVAKVVNYPIALQLVTDEEVGGFRGTKYQIEKGVRGDFIIAGESTKLKIVSKTKGIIWAKVTSKGKAAHGAYPWKGKNAIWNIYDFLKELEHVYPHLQKEAWVTTVNVSKIETKNTAFNKIPDDCTISLDIRYIPEDEKTIIKNLKKLLPQGCTIKILVKEPAHMILEDNSYLQALQKAGKEILKKNLPFVVAHGSSDVRHYSLVNGHGVEFGSIGKGIGTDKEYVDVTSLTQYYQILKTFLLNQA